MKFFEVHVTYYSPLEDTKISSFDIIEGSSSEKVTVSCCSIKKQEIIDVVVKSKKTIQGELLPIYCDKKTMTHEVVVIVEKTEKEAYKLALDYCRLLIDEPNLLYDFKALDKRRLLINHAKKYFPEILI